MNTSLIGYGSQYTIRDALWATMRDMNSIGQRMESAAHEKWGERWRVELKRATGLTRQTLHKIETGSTKNPTPANLFVIADAIDVTARWLGTGAGPRRASATLTEEERRWLALREMLTPDQQHSLSSFLDPLGEQRKSDAPETSA